MLRRLLSAVATPNAARAFSATPMTLATLNPYAVFLQQVYKNAAQKKELALVGQGGIGKRGKLIAKWYKALSAEDKAKLVKTAKATTKKPYSTKRGRFIARQLKSKLVKALPKSEQLKTVQRNWTKTALYGRK